MDVDGGAVSELAHADRVTLSRERTFDALGWAAKRTEDDNSALERKQLEAGIRGILKSLESFHSDNLSSELKRWLQISDGSWRPGFGAS